MATPIGRKLRALAINLGLAMFSIVLLLAVVEVALRLSGFSYVLYPREVEFGKPDPQLMAIGFTEDEDVFWVTPDYHEKLARLSGERPGVLFLGDSCTHLGHYDDHLAALVARRDGKALSFGNLGVAGWSSFQGHRQLERDVLPLQPAVVTIYYGWNDHWIGFGIEDKNVALIKRVFSGPWRHWRLAQLAAKAAVAIGARETAYPNRVSLADFSSNLRSMVRQARRAGIRPLLITAATSHREGAEPEELARRWLRELSELVPLHQSYVEAVRAVAEEEGAALCDAAAGFATLPRPEIERSFMADGIHLTAEGDRRLAEMLYECLTREEWLGLVTE